jgi:hypothetical protein
MRKQLFCLSLALAIAASGVDLLLARGPARTKPQPQPKQEEVNLTGTISSIDVAHSEITIQAKKTSNKNDKAKPWQIFPAQNQTVAVTVNGTATLDYLHPGQILQFNGVLDQSVIDKAALEKPVDDKADDKADEKADAKGDDKPLDDKTEAPKSEAKTAAKIAPKIAAKPNDKVKGEVKELSIVPRKGHNLGIGSEADKKANKEAVAAIDGPTKVRIVGKIQKVDPDDNHKLTITAGSHTLDVVLSAVPTINVELNDAKLVKVGAKVVVHGNAFELKSQNHVQADKIDITLVEPLTGKKKPASATTAKLPPVKKTPDADASTTADPKENSPSASSTSTETSGTSDDSKTKNDVKP